MDNTYFKEKLQVNAGHCGASVSKLRAFKPPRRESKLSEVTTVAASDFVVMINDIAGNKLAWSGWHRLLQSFLPDFICALLCLLHL